jgi:hypothetical protein
MECVQRNKALVTEMGKFSKRIECVQRNNALVIEMGLPSHQNERGVLAHAYGAIRLDWSLVWHMWMAAKL